MISRAELIKHVAERSGISPENSSYYFEVFINRISSRLKAGESTKFFNDGYFQKRNCRFPAEKSKEKPAGGSILAPLILFSEHAEIIADPKHFYAFRIPDLKTLWENDSDLLASLAAGDFAPAMNRSQLINTYATKAEVIISGFVKHHVVFEEELVIPFSLNLSLKEVDETKILFETGPVIPDIKKSENIQAKETQTPDKPKSTTDEEKTVEDTTLPWSFGKKFYDKKVDHFTPAGLKHKEQTETEKETSPESGTHKDDLSGKKIDAEEALDAAIEQSDIDDSRLTKFREFEPVRSKLSVNERNKLSSDEQNRLRTFQKKLASATPSPAKTSPKFTEVKPKSEAYHLKNDIKKLKKKKKTPDLSTSESSYERSYKPYRGNRTLLPAVMIISFVIVVAGAIYVYFIKGSTSGKQHDKIVLNVNPPPDVNIINRDYEYAVTYPYEKVEPEIPVEGINPDVFVPDKKPETKQVKQEENPVAVKQEEVKKEEIKKEEVKKEEPKKEETKTEVKPKTEPVIEEEKSSRIFLYNNYYIVYVGSYSSYAVADREAERYFNEGYNAFVEVEEIPGKPTRYKLNVGDFTSEQFAREFESKYLK